MITLVPSQHSLSTENARPFVQMQGWSPGEPAGAGTDALTSSNRQAVGTTRQEFRWHRKKPLFRVPSRRTEENWPALLHPSLLGSQRWHLSRAFGGAGQEPTRGAADRLDASGSSASGTVGRRDDAAPFRRLSDRIASLARLEAQQQNRQGQRNGGRRQPAANCGGSALGRPGHEQSRQQEGGRDSPGTQSGSIRLKRA
jgi:hypothetical protein